MAETSDLEVIKNLIDAGIIDSSDVVEANPARDRDQQVTADANGTLHGRDGDDIYLGQDGVAETFFFDGRDDNNDEGRHVNVVQGFSFLDLDTLRFRIDGGFFKDADGLKIAQSTNGNQAAFTTARDFADLMLFLNFRDGVQEGIGKTINQADIDANTAANGKVDGSYRTTLKNDTTDGSFVSVVNGHVVMNFDDGRANGETVDKWGNYITNDVMIVFENFEQTLAARFANELGFTGEFASNADSVHVAQGNPLSGGAGDNLFILSNAADTILIDDRDTGNDEAAHVNIIHGFDLSQDSLNVRFDGGFFAGQNQRTFTGDQGIRDLLGFAETIDDTSGDLIFTLQSTGGGGTRDPLTIVLTDITVGDVTSGAGPLNVKPSAVGDTVLTDEDTAVTVNVLINDTDSDGDTLTVVIASSGANGTTLINPDGSITYTPDTNFNGSDSISYTVSDGRGGTDTATVAITVNPVNDAPTTANDSATTPEDTAVTINVLANDTDIDGDVLTISAVGAVANGMVTNNGDGTLTYTPDAEFSGSDSVSYTVSDGQGGTDTATVAITVNSVNDAPNAVNDSVTTLEDTAVTIRVLSNDTDIDGDSLSITRITSAMNGSISFNIGNTITYTPNANFAGQDSFTYTIGDGLGGINSATVAISVTPINDIPVAVNDVVETTEGSAVIIDVLANDTDADDDSLSITNAFAFFGSAVINADGTITYTPGATPAGFDSITYGISDGNGGTATATVAVTVNNRPEPAVFGGQLSGAVTEDQGLTPQMLLSANGRAGVSDPDSPLIGGLSFFVAESIQGTFGTLTIDAIGNWTYLAPNNVNAIQGLAAGETLEDRFTVTQAGAPPFAGDTGEIVITINGTNDGLMANADTARTDESTSIVIDAVANDTDEDGDSLFVSAIEGQATTSGVPVELASGALIVVRADGSLGYSANNVYDYLVAGETATETINYTVSDGNGATGTATITITIDGRNQSGVVDLARYDLGISGFVINGANILDQSGESVSGAGDVNGDGLEDIIVGASRSGDPSNTGSVYLVYGKTDGTPVNLSDVANGIGGFVINGASPDDLTGRAVSGAGDVNGDGLADLIIGAPDFDERNPDPSLYVTFPTSGEPRYFFADAPIRDFDLNRQTNAFDLQLLARFLNDTGPNDNNVDQRLGLPIIPGDFPSDGIVKIPNWDESFRNSGATFVVFGKQDNTAVDLTSVESGVGGFMISNNQFQGQLGFSVNSAGDLNSDGLSDIVIGAPLNSQIDNVFYREGGSSVAGVTVPFDDQFEASRAPDGSFRNSPEEFIGVDLTGYLEPGFGDFDLGGNGYVVFGRKETGLIDVDTLEDETGTDGFIVKGLRDSTIGFSTDGIGDFNGDGIADIIIASQGPDDTRLNNTQDLPQFQTSAYIVYGKSDVSDVDILRQGGDPFIGIMPPIVGQFGTAGVVIAGQGFSGPYGPVEAVSGAGDVNGDGLADVIVGQTAAQDNGTLSGRALVIFGRSSSNTIDTGSFPDASGGFVINGVRPNDRVGQEVSSAGDLNGDGLDDLIVGAEQGGKVYIVYGKTGSSAVELSDVEQGIGGFALSGQFGFGESVRGAGDVNGDGFDDLAIGDPNAGPQVAGKTYIVFGADTGEATRIGEPGGGTVTGFSTNNVLIGSSGKDILIGNGGADVLRSGAGDDVIAISDLGFKRIDGGTGTDIVRLDGTGLSFDLSTVSDLHLQDVEGFDLNGGGNIVTLSKAEIVNLSSTSNTVRILGDGTAGDGVSLTGGGFTSAGMLSDGGKNFQVFVNGEARVEIEQGLAFIPRISLAEIASDSDARGFVINGSFAGDLVGSSISGGADFNGDGFDDLLINAIGPGGTSGILSATYLVLGKSGGASVSINDVLSGNGGVPFDTAFRGSSTSIDATFAGDVNADGFDDFILGVADTDNVASDAGEARVVFGKAALSGTTGTQGFTITEGVGGVEVGAVVGGVGDVNGDGLDDVIVSAEGNTTNGRKFVVFGQASMAPVDLSAIDGGDTTNGFKIDDLTGGASLIDNPITGAGDFNGDGFDDVIYGNRFASVNSALVGAATIVFGGTTPTNVTVSDFNGGTGITVVRGKEFAGLSTSISSAGDVNGDGYDDVIIGAPTATGTNGGVTGAAYVLFGSATPLAAIDIANIEAGIGGFAILGTAVGDSAGVSVSSAGDVNGDGLDDLLIGANGFTKGGVVTGGAYVVFGKTNTTTVNLDSVAGGVGGFVIEGIGAFDNTGAPVNGAGDVDGDGFDDILIGASSDLSPTLESGAAFVVFGENFTGAVDNVGTTNADTITGTSANDVFFGDQGNDTITGGGGQDRVNGGQGDDVFVFDDRPGELTIDDFEQGTGTAGDAIDLSSFDFSGFSDLASLISNTGPGGRDARIQVDSDSSILLSDFEALDLVADDFIF